MLIYLSAARARAFLYTDCICWADFRPTLNRNDSEKEEIVLVVFAEPLSTSGD